jgi:hypothetical protein
VKQETRWKLQGAAWALGWVALYLLLFALGALLAGCSATLPTVPARIAQTVECREPIPARPAMPTDNLQPGASLDSSVAAYQAEIAVREGYEGELVTALSNCTKPIKP